MSLDKIIVIGLLVFSALGLLLLRLNSRHKGQ